MTRLTYGWATILAILCLGFTACDDDDDGFNTNNPVIGTITDVAAGNPDFSTLVAALQRTGLDATLDNPSGRFTIFAPTNAAFDALGVDLGTISDEDLTDILLYHVLSGGTIYRAANIPDGVTSLPTANTEGPGDSPLNVEVNRDGGITVNGVDVVEPNDIEAVNGVIHAIDEVLVPPTLVDRAVGNGSFTTLVAALQRTGLDSILNGGNFTVFAPTDDAFDALGVNLDDLGDDDLTNILLYHVLDSTVLSTDIANGQSFPMSLAINGPNDSPLSLLLEKEGSDVTVNDDASVVIADVPAANGVIHAIDRVLMPQSIVDFATKADALSSLAGAVTTADLVTTLSGDGPFTVFAPVNGAFAAADTVVMGLSAEQLVEVLTYHVVSGNVRAEDIAAGDVQTVNDDETFELLIGDDDGVNIVTSSDTVPITMTDIQGTNGVVHLIGSILIPENL